MAAVQSSQASTTSRGATSTDTSGTAEADNAVKAVTEFFGFIKTLESQPSYRYLQELFDNHLDLQSECSRLETAHDVTVERHTQLQQKLKNEHAQSVEKDAQLEKIRKEQSQSATEIRDLQKQLEESKKTTSQLQDTLKVKDSEIKALKRDVANKESAIIAAQDAEKKAKDGQKASQVKLNSVQRDRDAKEKKLAELVRLAELGRLGCEMEKIPSETM